MTPELHRPVPLDRIGAGGLEQRVEATEAECAALAARMDIPAVRRLSCDFRLTRPGMAGIVLAEGRLQAVVTQLCVVTLEEFDAAVEEGFRLRFVPAGQESEELDPDSDDEIPYDGPAIDLGEATAEQLALALDPYPRSPGALLPETDDGSADSPFAALARRLPRV